MSRYSTFLKTISVVQIIILMICTLLWNVLPVQAEDGEDSTVLTTESTPVTESTVVPDVTEPPLETTTEPLPDTTTAMITTTVATQTVPPKTTAAPTTTTRRPSPTVTLYPVRTTRPTTKPTGAATVTTTTAPNTPSEDVIDSVQQLQASRQELQEQALILQAQREEYSDTLSGLLLQKSNLEEQIVIKQREIDVNDKLKDALANQIFANDRELMAQEQQVLVRRQSILERFHSIRKKLRAMSKDGYLSVVQALASSDNYTSFLISEKLIRRMTAIDETAMNQLEQELDSINEQRRLLRRSQEKLEEQHQPYVDAAVLLEQTRFELIALLDDAKQVSLQLNTNLAYNRMEYLTLSAQHSFLYTQIEELLKDYENVDFIAPTQMVWPAPECTIITSSYKSRWNRWHYGLDIASWGDSTGKSIVAAANGTVIFADEDDSGFGKYVMIDHGYDILGRRIVTLYAHCNDLYVSKGDIVFGGKTAIAAVGNTGDSDGAHLHFEVRVDGTAVDPIGEGYLSTQGITISG